MRIKTRKTCLTSAGKVHIRQLKFSAGLFMSVNNCKGTASINLGVTNKFK